MAPELTQMKLIKPSSGQFAVLINRLFQEKICLKNRISTELNTYKVLNQELGLPTQPIRPSGFVPRLASDLGVSDQLRPQAQRLAEHSEAVDKIVGVRPSGFAAACLYCASQECG